MPGPRTEAEARAWIKAAMAANAYTPDPHFGQRMAERSITMFDVRHVMANPSKVAPYKDATLLAGGTPWRVSGTSLDGVATGVGVELYLTPAKVQRILFTTVF